MYNVIAEKKGTSDQYIIVCGHYDTRNGVWANDNGSGVAVIMEMARLLFDIPTKYSIRFINFSGEESGLLGSTHYANNVVGANDSNLLLVFNIDQLGGSKGQNDNFKIKCESDQDDNPNSNNAASLAITQKLAKVLGLYTSLTPVLDKAYASDYVPFEKLGYTITGLYQYSYDPFNHTSNDLIENMDTVSFKEIGKGSIACLLHLAEASFLASTKEVNSKPIAIYPNPSNGKFNVQFGDNSVNATHYSIHSIDGRIIRSGKIIKNEIDLKNTLLPGIYVIEIHNFSNILSYHKIQIIAD